MINRKARLDTIDANIAQLRVRQAQSNDSYGRQY